MAFAEAPLKVNYNVRSLCVRPYPGHPKGCPNFGKRETCPPGAPLIEKIIDPGGRTFLIWNIFDLASHVARLKGRHPNWSIRQLECCLYWQSRARKQLEEAIK